METLSLICNTERRYVPHRKNVSSFSYWPTQLRRTHYVSKP
jgi:hypothetical protein